MNAIVLIAIVALALIGAIALLGLVVLALAITLWIRASRARPAEMSASGPLAPGPFAAAEHDDPATEVFDRGRMFAVYDSDDLDKTELVRLDGGILLDGRTDPAISMSELNRPRDDKD